MRLFLSALLFLPAPALADVDAVIDRHILPGYAAFDSASIRLENAALEDCRAEAVAPAYNAAFDAWMGISHINFGPVETASLRPAIAFWPDSKNSTGRHLARLIAANDPAVYNIDAFREVSIAARGLFALERMLFDEDLNSYTRDSYSCALVEAITADLTISALALTVGWVESHAETLRTAGAEGNETYLSEREAQQALYTALLTGLEFDKDQRLGRPLGTFDRPRPMRAEARRSLRSLRNVTLSLTALRNLAELLTDGAAPQTLATFDRALAVASDLDDPGFAGVATPGGRLKVEILAQHITAISDTAAAEIGPTLGVSAGFNALDGD